MSFFGSFFGPAAKYSKVEHHLQEIEIKKLVSEFVVKSLTSGEENLVEQAIIARRRGDGKISLQQIYEVLTQLKNQHKISLQDRDGLLSVFVQYYKEHFQN